MANTVKIVIDTQGGDNGPEVIVAGAAMALEKFPELQVLLVGDEQTILAQCRKLHMPMERVEILHAANVITNYDTPMEVLYHKPDSSMLRALQALANRQDLFGLLTAGNTAVLLTGAVRYLSGKERVRPAMAALLPAQNGTFTCLVDTGATVDCTSAMLHHFAKLGSSYMRDMYGIERPKVGLLSNGTESTKGNRLVKETYPVLAEDRELNFVGTIEGSNALSGDCDVLVCDGFAGNLVLKVTEGTAMRLMTDIAKYAKRSDSREIGELFTRLMGVYDIRSLGGGSILGVAKPVIKVRGNTEESGIVNTAEMLLNMSQNKAALDTARNKI